MYSKHRRVGGIYKKETDWGAIIGTIFWVFFGLALIGALVG